MQIKITQCAVGKYNILSPSEESLSFYMGIYDDDNQLITEGENKAQLYYNGNADNESLFKDALNEIADVFELCYEYGSNVISSTDYKGNCILFARTYQANLEMLDKQAVEQETKKAQKQIERLHEHIKEVSTGMLYDISEAVNTTIDKEIKKYTIWKESGEKGLQDMIVGSDSYVSKKQTVDQYEAKIEKLKAQKLVENVPTN